MSHDTLVFLCNDASEAVKAAARVPRHHTLKRFFIFLGEPPLDAHVDWIVDSDIYMVLTRAQDWTDSVEAVSIRAGALYTNGWNTLFCWASNPPSEADVDFARRACDGPAMVYTDSKLWGYSREYLVRFGFPGSVYTPQSTHNLLPLQPVMPDITTELAKAMRGQPVSDDGVIAALKECAPITSVKVEITADMSENTSMLCEKIFTSLGDAITLSGDSILLCGPWSELEIADKRFEAKRGGCVIVVTDANQIELYESPHPYRVIKSTSGVAVLLFSNRRQ